MAGAAGGPQDEGLRVWCWEEIAEELTMQVPAWPGELSPEKCSSRWRRAGCGWAESPLAPC